MVWDLKEPSARKPVGRNLWEAAESGDLARLEELLVHLTSEQMGHPGGVYGWSALSAAVHGERLELRTVWDVGTSSRDVRGSALADT